jgi:hypothetical protein
MSEFNITLILLGSQIIEITGFVLTANEILFLAGGNYFMFLFHIVMKTQKGKSYELHMKEFAKVNKRRLVIGVLLILTAFFIQTLAITLKLAYLA